MGDDEHSDIVLNQALVTKIQNYMNDPLYRESIENAAAFNSRLATDRTQRLPFLDSQTGVAQNHSSLWMEPRHRLPGFQEGQIYSYPSKRWRKKRRQYLHNFLQPRYVPGVQKRDPTDDLEPPVVTESVHPVAPGHSNGHGSIHEDSHSRDGMKEDSKPPEAWYYDDLDMPDPGEFDEPDADSDYDYEESYNKKKKKNQKGKPGRPRTSNRRKINYDAVTDPDKPFSCDICGARYKTRPGLTYHYTHSHKDKEEDGDDDEMGKRDRDRDDAARRFHNSRPPMSSMQPPILHPQHPMQPPPQMHPQGGPPHPHMMQMGPGGPGVPPPGMMMGPPPMHMPHHPPPPHLIPQQPPPPHLMQQQPPSHSQAPGQHPPRNSPPPPTLPPITNVPTMMMSGGPGGSNNGSGSSSRSETPTTVAAFSEDSRGSPSTGPEQRQERGNPGPPQKPKVQPSLYCDFCLGDAAENKKSGGPEELVSCSDCGRSGHPTCLQFTANMIISVKKYRWQCIECKCCTICGTSDNDDQLLFCDDCDRGYHMYCLSPPLDQPPEGSWSCTLCLAEFHQK